MNYDTIDEKVPSGFTFGNVLNNGLLAGMGIISVESPNEKIGIRFTSIYDGIVNEMKLALIVRGNGTLNIGIQEDDGNGFPSNQWIDEPITITKETIRFESLKFKQGINLQKGKVYHIILEPSKIEESFTSFDVSLFRDNYLGRPLNLENPDIYSEDPFINSLFYDGTNWEALDQWPMFLLNYEDGKSDGQPYTLAAQWTIRNSTYVGQTLIPSSDYNVSKIGIVIGKKGNPSDALYYGIVDSKNNLLSQGVFSDGENLHRYMNWVEINFDDPLLFSAGELYRIFLYSPIPRGEDSYELYGDELSLDNNLGYGGERHRLTISHDAGERWAAWYDADVIFSITTE